MGTDKTAGALLDAPAYPNRLCHIDYTAHPYRCGCLKGDEEAQRRFDEHQGKVAQPQHTAVEFLERMLKGSGDDRLAAWHGEMAMLLEHVAEQPAPDAALCGFYEVTGYPSLVRELVGHVAQLQELAKRNVKPWEDTFPPTLLPAYIERVNAANAAIQHQGELVAEIVEFGFGLKEISWKGGKMPEVGVRLYSAPPAAPVPGGWKLVPINPTPDMLKAVDDEASDKHLARGRAISAWGLMLDAAPLPSIRDLHYGVAHAVECQQPAQRLVGGYEIGGLHFPAPSQLAAAVAGAGDGRALEPAEPILVEAVAVTRECDEEGLRLEWLLEGGIAALEHPGTVLLVAQGTLTNDSGNGYVYPARNPEDDE